MLSTTSVIDHSGVIVLLPGTHYIISNHRWSRKVLRRQENTQQKLKEQGHSAMNENAFDISGRNRSKWR